MIDRQAATYCYSGFGLFDPLILAAEANRQRDGER